MFLFKPKKREKLEVPKEKNGEAKYVEKYDADNEGKGVLTHIAGEKHVIKGQPTSITLGAIEMIKSLIDKLIASRLPAIIINEIPEDKMSKPVREIAKAFDLIIEAEKLKGHKKRWNNYKKMMCFFLENDIAWRYRWQWFMEQLDMSKIRLDEDDKYFFRVKNFRVDLKKEWEEALKAYPQLKNKMIEFKKFVAEGWIGKEDDWKLEPLTILAEHFLELNKTI